MAAIGKKLLKASLITTLLLVLLASCITIPLVSEHFSTLHEEIVTFRVIDVESGQPIAGASIGHEVKQFVIRVTELPDGAFLPFWPRFQHFPVESVATNDQGLAEVATRRVNDLFHIRANGYDLTLVCGADGGFEIRKYLAEPGTKLKKEQGALVVPLRREFKMPPHHRWCNRCGHLLPLDTHEPSLDAPQWECTSCGARYRGYFAPNCLEDVRQNVRQLPDPGE